MTELEGQTSSTPDQRTFVHIDQSRCHVVTTHALRYALIGQPRLAGPASKLLQLAAFAPVAPPLASECTLRIYFVENTLDAMEVRLG